MKRITITNDHAALMRHFGDPDLVDKYAGTTQQVVLSSYTYEVGKASVITSQGRGAWFSPDLYTMRKVEWSAAVTLDADRRRIHVSTDKRFRIVEEVGIPNSFIKSQFKTQLNGKRGWIGLSGTTSTLSTAKAKATRRMHEASHLPAPALDEMLLVSVW